jgi:hypothetical protein
MSAPSKQNELWANYRQGLMGFLGVLERAERDGKLNDTKSFASLLNLSLTRYGFSASELAHDEEISKAAISKWMHELALPPAPTRKTVINWIKRKAQEQLDELV